jgi:hypothetical protein
MINMLKTWFTRLPDLSAVIARFPFITIIMAAFTILLMFQMHEANEDIFKLLLGLILSAYVSFCIVIACTSKQLNQKIWLQLLATILVCALVWFFETLHINLAMAFGAVLLLLGNMVLWRQSRNDLHLWDFTHKIWTGAVFATLGSIIFTLGVFAISFALKSLFGLDINDLVTDIILPIGLGFLAPLYWLSTVPQTDESYAELYENPSFVSKAVAFLGTWLLSPLTLIYALILLAYAVKIVITGTLPKGEIAGLTTPFLIIGALTWLVLEPPFIKDKFLARLFRKSWFFLSIPAALLLAVSVFVRVQEYGLTPERFALILAVIWALLTGLWFICAPQAKRDIRFIPGFAAVLLLIGTFAAVNISLQSQVQRLKANLEPAGILNSDGTLQAGPILDISAARKVKGSLIYLNRHSGENILKRTLKSYDYEDYISIDQVFRDLGLKDVKLTSRYNSNYTNDRFEPKENRYSVEGYAYSIGPLTNYLWNNGKETLYSGETYTLTSEKMTLTLTNGNDILAEFDISEWLDAQPVIEGGNNSHVLEQSLISLYYGDNELVDLKVHSIDRSQNAGETTSLNIQLSLLIKELTP